ncbi:acidic leucine-rich nuclear phosphoprotein 32-related protein 1-like [Cryptomeria japonica]|uniref:acidic leucine-rich nuclear phosphoprotein 32-related protein 1-like n=1 Tax=Cryptomeria japonica TaxID=3369 RepID=UPI0025AD6B12|nr:acidic leucine-rich nuclear phosphoprotein 32-related protein 1-like [Cryptomeria japonica]
MRTHSNPIVIDAIKWVLGDDFVGSEDRYCVNTDITSRFVTSLLDIGLSKHLAVQLTDLIFLEKYLGGLEEVVAFADPIRGIATTSNLRRYIDHDFEEEFKEEEDDDDKDDDVDEEELEEDEDDNEE